jgi:tRNA (cytidine/uridine-2'-O-)-methyltransferase
VFHVALYEPEIPPNTGNIIRLCANTGAQLHLIHPLGFAPNDKQLQRAGLDYHSWTQIIHHENYTKFLTHMADKRIFACSTHGARHYSDVTYQADDVFLFGPETRGLPKDLLNNMAAETVIRIPMMATSRSLNLANAAAVVVYEAWRQQGFSGK